MGSRIFDFPRKPKADMNDSSIAKLIDHALLHPTLKDADIQAGCETAAKLGVASVCVKPYAIKLAAEVLKDSGVGVGTVIGFPHGSHASEVKAFEAETACRDGAVELDMVVNVGKVLDGDWDYVKNDIDAVLKVARANDAILKVIFETDFVTERSDKVRLCEICDELGVDYVKTSTGFGYTKQSSGGYGYTGATEDDIALMRETCSDKVGVKASGGIRTFDDAAKMRELGATRLGASASETIVTGEASSQEGY
ncbi:MAG: deoxyribose-phosphate aldolase [Planctomycetota bacterium]